MTSRARPLLVFLFYPHIIDLMCLHCYCWKRLQRQKRKLWVHPVLQNKKFTKICFNVKIHLYSATLTIQVLILCSIKAVLYKTGQSDSTVIGASSILDFLKRSRRDVSIIYVIRIHGSPNWNAAKCEASSYRAFACIWMEVSGKKRLEWVLLKTWERPPRPVKHTV